MGLVVTYSKKCQCFNTE